MTDGTADATIAAAPTAPLAGVRVLELARVLAGPWAGQVLADLGADVVKLEGPQGDETRHWGPPFLHRGGEETAAYFHCCNRGKRSLVADLKTADGRRCAQQLAARADVIVENFKVGGLQQYGLDYASVVAAGNAQVVYCAISGFGQTGTMASMAGYDFLVQGLGGVMSVTGEPGGMPQKVGVAIMDIFTGVYAVVAVQAALAKRAAGGGGSYVDLSLLDSAVAVMANQSLNYLATGTPPQRLGNAHPNIAPYQVFAVADGHVIITIGNDTQFCRLCVLLEAEALANDARFTTNAARVRNRVALAEALQTPLTAWTRAAFLEAAAEGKIPAAPINNLAEVFAHPQVQHRQMQIETDGMPGVRLPVLFDGRVATAARPAPNLGEHTQEVIADWLSD